MGKINHKLAGGTSFVRGLRDGMPICLGYISVSFAFGMMVTENGMPVWLAVLIFLTKVTSAPGGANE